MLKAFKYPKVWYFFVIGFFVVITCAALFSALEGWNYLDSVYFTLATLTTVGYGDVVPTLLETKLIAIGLMALVVPMVLMLLSILSELILSHFRGIALEPGEKKKIKKDLRRK